MKNILFKYTLYDAWWQKYSSIEILDKPDNNVILVKNDEKTIISVNKEFIEKIKDTIKKFNKLKEVECCDFPPILDGCINRFEVKINNKIHEITAYNCGDPIKLDQIPERIYIFSGIFYAAFFFLNSIGLKYPNFSFILSLL